VLTDGTVWAGTDSYPEAELEAVVLDEDWTRGVAEIAPERAELTPGVTYLGQRINYVIHRLGSNLRTEAYSVAPGEAFERVLGGLRREVDFSRFYPARVILQNADGTLQLVPVVPPGEKLGLTGLDRVPIRLGVPGTVLVPPGTTCRVGFDAGDPSRPFATAFDDGSLTLLSLGAGSDFVALATLVSSQLSAIVTGFNTHTHVESGGTTAVPVPQLSAPGPVAATKVKAE
jgi:hypothetical protein